MRHPAGRKREPLARTEGPCSRDAPRVIPASAPGALRIAAEALKRGRIVAFPTETVYGLAVRMGDARARERLRRAKGRPGRKPFQVIVSSLRRAMEFCPEVPPAACRLAREFWPGPLTLVLKARKGRSLGLRLPAHPVARKLAAMGGGAIIATSANPSGEPPATTAGEVVARLGRLVDVVLDGGRAWCGEPSSVVRVTSTGWQLLREGAIEYRALARVIEGIRNTRRTRE